MATASVTPPPLTFESAWASFVRHRRAEHISEHTLKAYTAAANQLLGHLVAHDRPTAPELIEREDVQDFIGHLLRTRTAATAATRYWGLRAFFSWLVDEGEIEQSPLDRVKPPTIDERPPGVLSDEELIALLNVCKGRGFDDRRDAALIRFMVDAGVRVGEVATMTADRLDLDAGVARVIGKGRRERDVCFGVKATRDLDRYLRVRDSHRCSELPGLWLGLHGALTTSGIGQMLKGRAVQAALDPVKIHAHLFRHTFAHMWKASGGSEEDLMSLGGWRSPTVMRRYGSSFAAGRARDAHRRLSPGDRL